MLDEVIPYSEFSVKWKVASFAFLIIFCFILYLPMLDNYYFADILDPIIASQQLQDRIETGEGSILEIFRTDYIEVPERYNTHFRPMGYLNAYLIYLFFGTAPQYLCFLTILTHVINVILVFLILKILFKHDLWAFLTAFIFGIEGIASDALFYLGAAQLYFPESVPHYICLLGFVYYIHNRRIIYLIISYLTALIAFFGNEFAWHLIPTILTISFFWEHDRNWKFVFKKKFIPYYAIFVSYLLLARACIVERPGVASNFWEDYFGKRLSGEILTWSLSRIGDMFYRIPFLGNIFKFLPEIAIGSIVTVIVFLIMSAAWIKIKDHRFRFLILWFLYALAIILPLAVLPRYLYHPSVPFWGASIFIILSISFYLQRKLPSVKSLLNYTLIAVLTGIILSHIGLNRKREMHWDSMGTYQTDRISSFLEQIDHPPKITKIYYISQKDEFLRIIPGACREMTSHLMVFLDYPYIEWKVFIEPIDPDTLTLKESEYLFEYNGYGFDLIKDHRGYHAKDVLSGNDKNIVGRRN